jgi:ATP adenylyltransferase
MKHLFSPWRSGYINLKQPNGCFLCRAVEQRKDKANLLLFRGERSFIIMNRFPYNNGHLMIAPYRHTGDITRLTADEAGEMFALLQQATGILRRELRPEGFNVGMNLGRVAGAGLAGHLHLHVVPRWNGDTNFMPTLADTKVISEGLDMTWHRLRKQLVVSSE